MNNKIKDRHLELSSKLIEMGNALISEGSQNKDYITSQSGTFLILIGGLLFDENDVQLFSQLCGMFSAKKILENMEDYGDVRIESIKAKSIDETYEDFIKRINKLREDNRQPPIGD